MADRLIFEYEQSLASLSGDDFQSEIIARLQGFIIDFQPIPPHPQGDAGLDGISHGGKHGYCCYGLEPNQFKTDKDRTSAVVEKFKSDLRRICELEFEKNKLRHCDNAEIATILPDGKKIQHVTLLPNWFGSHRVLNPITTALAKYLEASQCRYIEKNATVVILGPKQLANRYTVDEVTIARARQRVFIEKIEEKAASIALISTEKFDKKMTDLVGLLGGAEEPVTALKGGLQAAWRKSLAFEQELNDTLPGIHRDLELRRSQILTKVSMLMVASSEPWKELERATQIASELLGSDLKKLYGALVDDLSCGEIARLIGECPVGWEKGTSI